MEHIEIIERELKLIWDEAIKRNDKEEIQKIEGLLFHVEEAVDNLAKGLKGK